MAEDEAPPEPDRVEGYPHPRETRDLCGQARAEAAFLDAWAGGRLHHAWLLRGPQGIGKATLAYRIARALIAQPADMGGGLFGEDTAAPVPTTLAPPEDCPVRARILSQAEPRLFVLRRTPNPDTGRMRGEITVDQVRRMREFLQLSATDGGWRVIIVDAMDEMNRAAANALLKYLEEPPAETLFVLVCHAPAGLLPTIRSRCRTLDLAPLAPPDLASALAGTGAAIAPGTETALAELGGGSAGEALRLIAGDGLMLYARIVALLSHGQGVDRAAMTALAEQCAGRAGADRYRAVLALALRLLARLARAAATGQPPPEAAPDEASLFARVATHTSQGAEWAEALARIAATTRHAVAVNLDPAQCVIDTFLEIDATLGRVRAVAA